MAKRSLGEIEADIDRTRAALGLALDRIEHKFAPRQIMKQGLDMIDQTVRANASGVLQAVTRNPIPLALIGIGVGWLVATPRRRSKPAVAAPPVEPQATGDAISRTAARIEHLAATVAEQLRSAESDDVSEAVTRLRRRANGTNGHDHQAADDESESDSLIDRGRNIGESVYERAVDYAEEAGDAVRDMGDRVSETIDRYPLAVGGLAAVAGVLLALGLPPTLREDRLFGSTRDSLRDRALDSGRDTLARVEDTAGRAAASALDAARQEIDGEV